MNFSMHYLVYAFFLKIELQNKVTNSHTHCITLLMVVLKVQFKCRASVNPHVSADRVEQTHKCVFICDGKVTDMILRQMDRRTREDEAAERENLVSRKKRQQKDGYNRQVSENEETLGREEGYGR